MEKCTVKRIPAGSETGESEQEPVAKEEEQVEAFPEEAVETGQAKPIRRIGGSLDSSSPLMTSENLVAAVVMLALVLILCLVRGGQKNEAKKQ